jgi:hypothetical protein
MNADLCIRVCRRSVGIPVVALVIATGCTPHNISWRDTTTTIQPEVMRPEPPQPPQGFLSIETQHFGEPGDEEEEMYPPVYLYDRNGNLLSQLSNNTDNRMPLPPGEYIVIIGESLDPLGEFRQLQVRVVDGQATRVSQADIDHAPEFWALSRYVSH